MIGKAFKIVGKAIVYGLLALLIWVVALDWAAARVVYSPHPEAIHRMSTGSKTGVVYLTGVQSSGLAHSAPLRELWSKHGDVIVVEYNPKRFDAQVTAYDVVTKLVEWRYERVLLIGASLGGLLATDVIDMDRATGSRLKFAVIMADVPQSKEDLHETDKAEVISLLARPGPVTNRLLTDLVWLFFYDPPPHYMLGKGVDDAQLTTHYGASSNYPLSGWAGQVRYIVTHRGYERNQYVGIPLVVMQSTGDGVVKPTADKWKPIFGGGATIQVPETTHIGFVEYPDRWRAAFAEAFAALPGW